MITTKIKNFEVKRTLVKDSSTVEAIWLKETNIEAIKTIYGFANQPIKVINQITLPVKLDQRDNKFQVMAHLLVVDQTSNHNAIFRRPFMKFT